MVETRALLMLLGCLASAAAYNPYLQEMELAIVPVVSAWSPLLHYRAVL
jgi:hypothetical protein